MNASSGPPWLLVTNQLFPHPSRHRSTARLQPLFVEFYDVSPGLNKRERCDRHATFGGDALEATLKPLPRRIIFRTGGQKALTPLRNFLIRRLSAVGLHPGEQFLIHPTSQHSLLKRFRVDLEKINQVLIEPHCDVVVVLNLANISQPNLVDKSPEVGDTTEKKFRT